MKVFNDLQEFQLWRATLPRDLTLGFVPTMGALHAGHSRLIEVSRRETDLTVLSIFVNPTQFNNPEDFEKYPSTMDADLKLAETLGVDAVFLPDQKMMYPDDYRFKLIENNWSKELCGKFRPGHFDGVLTIVLKLFNIVSPHQAFFGEKDFQQLSLIREMTESLFLPVLVVPVPTVRETTGLALSSRNTRLTPKGRKQASLIYETLIKFPHIEDAETHLIENGFEVEYIEDHRGRRFIAAQLEGVRLIDNVPLAQVEGLREEQGELS